MDVPAQIVEAALGGETAKLNHLLSVALPPDQAAPPSVAAALKKAVAGAVEKERWAAVEMLAAQLDLLAANDPASCNLSKGMTCCRPSATPDPDSPPADGCLEAADVDLAALLTPVE
jgi:hypothetical protein